MRRKGTCQALREADARRRPIFAFLTGGSDSGEVASSEEARIGTLLPGLSVLGLLVAGSEYSLSRGWTERVRAGDDDAEVSKVEEGVGEGAGEGEGDGEGRGEVEAEIGTERPVESARFDATSSMIRGDSRATVESTSMDAAVAADCVGEEGAELGKGDEEMGEEVDEIPTNSLSFK